MESKEKSRVTVSIMGEDYVLRGTSSADEMDRVGRYVDRLMRKLAESNIQMSRHRVAVLAALNLADELIKLKTEQGKVTSPLDRKDEADELV
jgi:cell division protein ZapA